MTTKLRSAVLACILPLAGLLSCPASHAQAAEDAVLVAGKPPAEARRLGEVMYTRGILPSGEPMRAVVTGDIEIRGTMVTCFNCHMRAGLGSYEGGVFTPPTNGAKLYAPLRGGQDIPGGPMKASLLTYTRPAYTDETLVRVLRTGVDPKGRTLSPTMPRYTLDDADAEIMVHYLKNLSAKPDPGVDEEHLTFAVVLSDGLDPREREAVLAPLRAYVREEWNVQQPVLSVSFGSRVALRKIALEVWDLKGPPGTWGGQLEDLYRKRPVFALLGGSVRGGWDPIHAFCEKNRIPCIFPLTDLPAISAGDWYTLYLSKGYYQEGEAAAEFLARVFALPPEKSVVQVFRDTDEGRALSRGFAEVWKKLGNPPAADRVVASGAAVDEAFWRELAAAHPDSALLLWLGAEDLARVASVGGLPGKPSTILVSATLLGGKLASLPDAVRDFTFITYPTRLPEDEGYGALIVGNWAKLRKIPVTDLATTTKIFFQTRMLTRILKDMGVEFYRDYFLDLFDELTDQASVAATYPRLSFGPGQRYASKGCYVVTLTKGPEPRIVRQSDWVIF